MCNKCQKKSCNGCNNNSSDSGQLANQVSELQDSVNAIMENIKFLLCGHPILLVDLADDVAQFDISSGLGSGCWDGWAICNGESHSSTGNPSINITTPNFIDRFIVQATGAYAQGTTGGVATVALTVAQLASHTHAITDPGHAHNINDPGHDHAITDPGHTHGGSGGSHTHTFSTTQNGYHEHSTGVIGISDGGGGTGANVRTSDANYGDSTTTDGLHSHTGTTDPAGAGVTIGAAFTGIDVTPAFTGITESTHVTGITVANSGNGDVHENLPPYYASLYVIKL